MSDPTTFSATEPDWSREYRRFGQWSPPRALIACVRDFQRARGPIGRNWALLRHRFWSVVTGADVSITIKAGGGLLLPHPNGVVISSGSSLGPNCMIFQQVTIGATRGGSPTIGGHVDIGAGAKILGPVTIGDHAQIGANAVVKIDVPDHGVAVGVPARLLKQPV